MGSGLSIATNLLANQASLNLNRNQQLLGNTVNQLSSGLRINNASDDPSGLAIAESLQAQVNGFQEAVQNVQNANNAATIAEGALQTTTDILQRIRSLAVEAASDINSTADKANLQAEVTQLLLEINRISQNTNYNGQALLDGSHAGFVQPTAASVAITSNSVLATSGGNPPPGQNAGLLVAGVIAANANFFTTLGATGTTDGSIELIVVNTGTGIVAQAYGISSATGVVTTLGSNVAGGTIAIDNVQITVGNITVADVGVTAYVKISQQTALQSNPSKPAFNFQSGADEGATITVGIQATNAATLRIANINVLASSAASLSLGAEDAIGQLDNALQILLSQRAQLGAVIVRLNEDANNDNIAAVNEQASESSIRDLNVGQATTQFTRLQILVQVGTSVLAQSNANAQSVLGLFR